MHVCQWCRVGTKSTCPSLFLQKTKLYMCNPNMLAHHLRMPAGHFTWKKCADVQGAVISHIFCYPWHRSTFQQVDIGAFKKCSQISIEEKHNFTTFGTKVSWTGSKFLTRFPHPGAPSSKRTAATYPATTRCQIDLQATTRWDLSLEPFHTNNRKRVVKYHQQQQDTVTMSQKGQPQLKHKLLGPYQNFTGHGQTEKKKMPNSQTPPSIIMSKENCVSTIQGVQPHWVH